MLLVKSLASVFSLLLYVLQTKESIAAGPIVFGDEKISIDLPIVPFLDDPTGEDIVGVRQTFFPTFLQKVYAPNSVCQDGNLAAGRCLGLKDCPNLLRIAKNPKNVQYTFLKFSNCGTFDNVQHFCCKVTQQISKKSPQATTSTISKKSPPAMTSKISQKSPPATTSKISQKSPPATTSKISQKSPPPATTPKFSKKSPPATTTKPICETSPDINFSGCGEMKLLGDRVVGGKVAEKNSIPWIALILKDSNPACGGTLITNRHVLSAAHCFVDLSGISTKDKIIVRLAEHDTSTKSDGMNFDLEINKIRIHEGYNFLNKVNDIAMIRLKRSVCFSSSVRPICIPDLSWKSRNLELTQPYVAGWGFTETQDFTSNALLQAKLIVFNTNDCRQAYAKYSKEGAKTLDYRTLCAGDVLGIRDSCAGDSGGPLVLSDSRSRGTNGAAKQFLIGIVSRGPRKCGNAGLPGIYIRVSSYFEWIKLHAV